MLELAPSSLRNEPFGKLETGPIKSQRLFTSFLNVAGNEFHDSKYGSFVSAKIVNDDKFL
jgi:hypothetical protein